MRRRTILVLAALGTLLCALPSTAAAASSAAPRHAAWTFAVYANEDNDLQYSWAQFTRRALRALPANADVNVVAMVDWRSVKKGVQLLKFSGGKVTVVASWPDKDFGSGATFEWFLKQVANRYPSDHLAVDICDHGYGWRYVSRDFTSHDRITMPELRTAIRRAATPIDILCFDACNMANIEAVSEFAGSGLIRYVVASEETVDQDGIPYGNALRPLMADPDRTPRQVATDMVSGWQMYYRPLRCFNWVSLTALDVGKVLQAKADITAWVARLRADLPQDRARYVADLHRSIYAWDCWYVDFADVARRLAADPAITDTTLKSLSTTVADDLQGAVVALTSGSYASEFKGITIWWGTGSDWRSDGRTYDRQIAFARDTGWYAFLKAYNAGHAGPFEAPAPFIHRAAYGLTDIAFADAEHGWATGYNNVSNEPVILRTVDGGGHWTTRSPAAWDIYMLSSLSFLDAQRVFAVGSEGDWESAIVKTVNGGGDWSWQDSGTVQYLQGVDFLDPAHGWLVGTQGTLLHTTNGGRAWTGARGASNSDLWSVDFADAAYGWISGGSAATSTGVIRHTSDGGATWDEAGDRHRFGDLQGARPQRLGGVGRRRQSRRRRRRHPAHLRRRRDLGHAVLRRDRALALRPVAGRCLHGLGRGRTWHGAAHDRRRPALDERRRTDRRRPDGGVVHGRRERLDRGRRRGHAAHHERRHDLDGHGGRRHRTAHLRPVAGHREAGRGRAPALPCDRHPERHDDGDGQGPVGRAGRQDALARPAPDRGATRRALRLPPAARRLPLLGVRDRRGRQLADTRGVEHPHREVDRRPDGAARQW